MKKFCVTFYLFALSLMVFAISGCGGSSGGSVSTNKNQTQTQAAQSKRMVISSPALKRGETYRLYRGDKVGVSGTTAKYYAAPSASGSDNIVMNLEYSDPVSEDLPFIITDSNGINVLFSYNPNGTGEDTSTTSVIRNGGAQQQLSYTNLNLSGSSVELDDSDLIDIVLNSDGTATAGGTAVPSYNYVWHADPQHPAQYWTLGDSTTELDENAYEEAITSKNNGVYIARDIRYTPNTLNFSTSNTAKKDEDTEYVVYYDFTSDAVKSALANVVSTYGSDYSSDKYIFATLPMSNGGMGGNPGGNMTPPSGNVRPNAAASDTSDIASFSTMTHSAEDAYANPVLHITEPGTYRLSGTWNGQIWVEAGAKSQHQVALILNGVTVKCTVAPALVFYKVYKWAEDKGYDSKETLSASNLWRNIGGKMMSDDGYYDVGAIVKIADGSTNTFTGANVYRLLELCPKLDDDDNPKYTGSGIGTDISEQEKMYKLDGAFHSRRTMVMGGGSAGTGKLTITSTTCEGLNSEMHMLIDGGNITVTAPDDAVNVNEDYVSVFQMDSGTLTVSSTNADGIDSNGWISVNGGTVNITAGTVKTGSAGESGMDAENADPYISDSATYNWTAANGNSTQTPDTGTETQTNTETETNKDTETQTNTDTKTYTDTTTPIIKTLNDGTVFTLFQTSTALEVDNEGDRNIKLSDDKFPLVHRVNNFAGLTIVK